MGTDQHPVQFTRSTSRWFPSLRTLVAFNATIVWLAGGAGWCAAGASGARANVRPVQVAVHGGQTRHDVRVILTGNLQVTRGLLAGSCTLGLSTMLELGRHSFVLGFGLSALTRSAPEIIPLLARYVPLEFSAFALAASAAEHLALTVLWCLAAGRTPRFTPMVATLAAALGMLIAAALIEADVARLVAGPRM